MNIIVTVTVETDDAHGPIDNDVLESARVDAEDAVAAAFSSHLGDSWSCEGKIVVDL